LNLWWNIQASPLEGIGFGVPYAKPYSMPDLSSFWPFWDYIPHNTLLWLWMKGGIFTFMSFWFLLGAGMSRLVEACKASDDRLLIAAGSCAGAFLTMAVLFSYVDLGLTNTRIMVILGSSLGLIGTIQRLVSETRARAVEESRK
jgi:O-antigen ligase